MRSLVTGGAGFIGSHLCDALIARGGPVWCVDNLHLGREANVAHLEGNPLFHFIKQDVLDEPALDRLFSESHVDAVFHLAANSDIQQGSADHSLDRRLNLDTTTVILEAMLRHDVKDLFFASTSAVFGENAATLREDSGPLRPISFYGASKLAAEAFISVYVNNYGFRARVLRFPNVIGPRMTHGAIFDFANRLRADPTQLTVFGNGTQAKPYMHVHDLVRAILLVWDRATEPLAVFHVGNDDRTTVAELVSAVVDGMGLTGIPIHYTGGDLRGWVGDVPRFAYDFSKIQHAGFAEWRSSATAVHEAVQALVR